MKIPALQIPFDAYERNRKIAGLLRDGESVLDVGGGVTGIKLFTDNPVTIVDLEVGDIKVDARDLKLKSRSYDVVVSIDVLEHIPAADRKKFVKNLIRIARSKVIVSAPHGGALHIKAEKNMLRYLAARGRKDFFLEQHVENGLPRPIALAVGKKSIIYSGDYRVSNLLFKLAHLESGNGVVDRLLLVLKRFINILFNLFVYPFWFYETEKPHTNRFYLLIKK